MLELIWGILNLLFIVSFIFICVKSVKVIKEKLGMFASVFFMFGLLSFITKPENSSSVAQPFNLQEKSTINHSFIKQFILEEQMVSVINLHIYFDNVNRKIQPSTAFSSREGFVSGTNWITKDIYVEKSSTENKYSYNVTGVLEWRILGFTLFSENKIFNGELSL